LNGRIKGPAGVKHLKEFGMLSVVRNLRLELRLN